MSDILISIIVIAYDMSREIPRTLQSLSPGYQQGVSEAEYEIIVVDNGSPERLNEDSIHSFGNNIHYHYIENATPSPVRAINQGFQICRGEYIGIMIDGARLVSPGVVSFAQKAFQLYTDPTVATLSWHLGPDIQNRSTLHGYNKEKENELLQEIDWPQQGYDLFKISALAGSSRMGWFHPIRESNLLFVSRRVFEELRGYDESFDLPGGGLANLDFYRRACGRQDSPLVVLLGEGTFHQLHGGIATNTRSKRVRLAQHKVWHDQYEAIRGEPFTKCTKSPLYLGHLQDAAKAHIRSTNKWKLFSNKLKGVANRLSLSGVYGQGENYET